MIVLAVDSCGSVGSIALGVLGEGEARLLGSASMPAGEISRLLIGSIAEVLASSGIGVVDLGGLVAVAGPGSFTGIRIGLAAVKAMAEALGVPVVAVSRLALLAEKSKARCAMLDAHRGQFFCGVYEDGLPGQEMLLTAGEINSLELTKEKLPRPVAVCEEAVAQSLEMLLGEEAVLRVSLDAYDALVYSAKSWAAGEFADVAALDGHYLRGADAKAQTPQAARVG